MWVFARRSVISRARRLAADALWRELKVKPDAATEALYRDIVSRQAPAVPPPAVDAAANPDPLPTPPAATIAAPPSPRRRARLLAGPVALAAFAVVIAIGGLAVWRSGSTTRPGAVLAVLPMTNLSGDAELEYVADGVTEALIHDLAQIAALRVISRTSVMRFKRTDRPLGTIARELGADLVVEGSVQQSGERVRITLQLIEAASDQHVFSRTFETTADRLFDTSREIARQVAREVSVQVTPAERARLDREERVHPEAYRNYLLGRHFWNRRTVPALRTAVEHFQRAVEIDPRFPRADAAIAESYALLGDEEFAAIPPREALRLTEHHAARALAIDPLLAEAHAARALALFQFAWDWTAAEQAFRLAFEANPAYATAYGWYGWFNISRGRFDDAITAFERARARDPLSLVIVTSSGSAYYFARRYEEALARYAEALGLDRHYPGAHVGRARVLEALGRYQEALAAYESAQQTSFDARQVIGAARMQAVLGDKAAAASRLNELEARRMYLPAVLRAQLHFALDEVDEAFDALSQAVGERSSSLLYLFVAPRMDAFRHDARFAALVRRVNPELERIAPANAAR